MTRTAATNVENNFVKGLITEATGMNFPENAASDTFDCVFRPIGAVQRRPGFQPEVGGVYQSVTDDTDAVYEFVWYNVANIGNLTFVVQQVGLMLYFFEVAGGALSPGLKDSVIDLHDFRTAGSPATSNGEVCQFAFGDGYLFVTNPHCEPFYVTYDLAADTLTGTQINLLIRDFTRQVDGLAIDQRPTTLTDLHKYNLYNQGWYYVTPWASNADNTHLHGADIVLNDFHAGADTLHNYPSNADIWWLAKNSQETFTPSLLDKVALGNTYAPNGHYIIPPFATNRQTQTGITGVGEDTAGSERPAACAFYAGRLWMGGCNSTAYGDRLYFSQILENINQAGNCYQVNDPTSEEDSDLFPSDGGVVVVQGMGTLVNMHPIGNALIVIATNGVWAIQGSQGAGFFANDYSVQKISENPGTSHMNVVEVEGNLMWWNYYGIYVLTMAPTGVATVQSATEASIKQFFQDIPPDNLPYVKGAYNHADFLVQWLYRSTVPTSLTESFQYDRVLNLRTSTQAYYPWTINDASSVTGAPSVSGIVCVKGSGQSRIDTTVVSNGQTVILA